MTSTFETAVNLVLLMIRVRRGKPGKLFNVCEMVRGRVVVTLWKGEHNTDLANQIPFRCSNR